VLKSHWFQLVTGEGHIGPKIKVTLPDIDSELHEQFDEVVFLNQLKQKSIMLSLQQSQT
jgi:hypothetical protein